MKTKIFLLASFCLGLSLASCNDDDDYNIYTSPIMTEDSVVTGSSDVTATTATLHATVEGVGSLDPSAFTAGFYWGYADNALTQSVTGELDGTTLTATLTGLTENTVIYYQAYVTLGGKVTYKGAVKSLLTTNAKVTTADATAVDFAGATMPASVTGAPADVTYGVVIATEADPEAVRAGLILAAGTEPAYSVKYVGLAPSTTYYYAGYADLGSGVVYGDVKTFTTSAVVVDIDNDMVDLGLSVKWAKHNVGAHNATENGGLFGYGDLTGVSVSIDPADFASADIYRTDRDIANRAWSGKVTLPTASDFEELFALCSKEWTSEDGVEGYKLTGPNGNSIFLPAAGSRTMSTVSNAGVTGVYATGSINPSDSKYAVAFRFGTQGQSRTSVPVYEALSVRPVSTARAEKLDMALLCTTWEIDYNNGECVKWNGPVWFMGADDCWGTITNNEPLVGDSWLWDADKGNTWAFGNCTGYMTINADGTIEVKNQNGEPVKGTYTIDPDTYVLTADIDLLQPDNFPSQVASTKSVKILSCTNEGLQLGYCRASDNCTLCVNFVPQTKKYAFDVKLMSVGPAWDGEWGFVADALMPADLEGKHTITYYGSASGAMVTLFDIVGLHAAYPDAIVTVSDIRLDGASIKFDPSKFFYGDIEDNGNFRVELFNIWGKGSNSEGNVDSPFSNTVSNGDVAFAYNSMLEIDYTITLDPTYTPKLATINKDWAGPWDYNEGATFTVKADQATGKYVPSQTSFTLDYKCGDIDFSEGTIMTFVEIKPLADVFPGTSTTLDGLWLDGKEVTGWNPAMIWNPIDGSGCRLELWNCFGVSSSKGCAFGTADGQLIHELGFTTSQKVAFTINSLFSPVTF